MERWQKIERCLAEFFRRIEFEIDPRGDVFAQSYQCDDVEFNITQLAKEIDNELGYDKQKDLSESIELGLKTISERVTAGGPGWEQK